eukprot:CAMPEP_0119132692 /NCGR_PEP_ID=MMETSP1310-20130426/12075_1 /TAXON_ID=464262 /ORGANISM="Genus nov. species nov., Strain RCC2339" /LENGTH=232 /DNA_ID=CAMNT_0007123337 /DNA_START=70 /DNA_END=768 /DNA_ORIENTATION=-
MAPEKGGKRVVVCVDHSESSESAFWMAMGHLNMHTDELHLVTVLDDSEYVDMAAASQGYDLILRAKRLHREKAKHFLRFYARRAKKEGFSGELHLVLAHGRPGDMIVEYVATHDIDDLYIGRRGMGRLERLVMGSVSKEVVNHADCNVFVVKKGYGPSEVHESSREMVKTLEEVERERRVEELHELEAAEKAASEKNRYISIMAEEEERHRRMAEVEEHDKQALHNELLKKE